MAGRPLTAKEIAEVKRTGISKTEAQKNRNRLMEINVRLEKELGRRPTIDEIIAAS